MMTGLTAPAIAGEAISYAYDALGRLTVVAHSGDVNSGLRAAYSYDAADNRTSVTVTGAASSTPAARVIVVPLGGFRVIPIG